MIGRTNKLIWPTSYRNKQGEYATTVARDIREKRNGQKKFFISDFKNKLIRYNTDIKDAVKEDKDNQYIIKIMNIYLYHYIEENISNAEYEKALDSYAYDIPKEKRRELYPNIKSIEEDFRVKMSQEIQTYANGWIEDFRIKYTLGKYANSIINAKSKIDYDPNQILEYLLQKYSNIPINDMPNLKNALINRINRIIEEKNKMKLSEKNE